MNRLGVLDWPTGRTEREVRVGAGSVETAGLLLVTATLLAGLLVVQLAVAVLVPVTSGLTVSLGLTVSVGWLEWLLADVTGGEEHEWRPESLFACQSESPGQVWPPRWSAG